MSRIFKFRAYDTIDKKWLFGYELPKLGGFNLIGDVTLMGELNSVSLGKWNDIDIMQFTGLFDNKNIRDVFESDIYFSEESEDYGDRRVYFVITWINERCAFVMLEVSEFIAYTEFGIDAISRDFEGFYYELEQDSIDKMHYAGNIHQNPELLTTPN